MRQITFFIALAAIFIPLVGCATGGVAVSVESEMALVTPAAVVEEAPTAQPTVAAPAPTQVAADQCLTCHADKDMLIDTAKPEEASGEGESKGVG